MRNLILFLFTLLLSLNLSAFANTSTGGEDDEKDKKKSKKIARPDIPGDLLIDFGFNFLLDNPSSLEMGFFGSKVVNFYYHWDIPIGKSNFSFSPGFGVGLEKYGWDGDNTLGRDENNNTVVLNLADVFPDSEIKNTKIAANYLDIPLEIRYHVNKENHNQGFRVAIGGKVGMLFDGHTKVKYKQDGDNKKLKQKDNFNLNRFRYGAHIRLGFPGVNIFGYYALNELFENGKGPEQTTSSSFNVGISIVGF